MTSKLTKKDLQVVVYSTADKIKKRINEELKHLGRNPEQEIALDRAIYLADMAQLNIYEYSKPELIEATKNCFREIWEQLDIWIKVKRNEDIDISAIDSAMRSVETMFDMFFEPDIEDMFDKPMGC